MLSWGVPNFYNTGGVGGGNLIPRTYMYSWIRHYLFYIEFSLIVYKYFHGIVLDFLVAYIYSKCVASVSLLLIYFYIYIIMLYIFSFYCELKIQCDKLFQTLKNTLNLQKLRHTNYTHLAYLRTGAGASRAYLPCTCLVFVFVFS